MSRAGRHQGPQSFADTPEFGEFRFDVGERGDRGGLPPRPVLVAMARQRRQLADSSQAEAANPL